jgi:hypothetical protein
MNAAMLACQRWCFTAIMRIGCCQGCHNLLNSVQLLYLGNNNAGHPIFC